MKPEKTSPVKLAISDAQATKDYETPNNPLKSSAAEEQNEQKEKEEAEIEEFEN